MVVSTYERAMQILERLTIIEIYFVLWWHNWYSDFSELNTNVLLLYNISDETLCDWNISQEYDTTVL